MYFCTVCGKILELRKNGEENIGVCSCGFVTPITELTFAQPQEREQKGEGVLKEESSLAGFPHICKKCGYGECDVVDLGPPISDESNVYLYRCKNCHFVERQADGTGNT